MANLVEQILGENIQKTVSLLLKQEFNKFKDVTADSFNGGIRLKNLKIEQAVSHLQNNDFEIARVGYDKDKHGDFVYMRQVGESEVIKIYYDY